MGLFNFWKKNQKEEPKSVAGTQKVISGIRALRQSQQAFQEGEEDKQTLIEQTGALIEEMNYSFGFNLKNSLPSGGIRSLDEGESKRGHIAFYDREKDEIVLDGTKEVIKGTPFGERIGEEIGHMFRKKCRRDFGKPDGSVSEFFGFLGRRMVGELGNKNQEINKAFPVRTDLTVTSALSGSTKRDLLETNRLIKSQAKTEKILSEAHTLIGDIQKDRADIGFVESHLTSFNLQAKSENLENARKSNLIHYRGYEWASKFDLSKVSNWKKLFSMSDNEVRMRFFRPDPDYSGF